MRLGGRCALAGLVYLSIIVCLTAAAQPPSEIQLDPHYGERFREAKSPLGSWAARMRAKTKQAAAALEQSVRKAGLMARQANVLLECKSQIEQSSEPTLCVPSCTHDMAGGFPDTEWRRITNVLPVCFGKQSPCLPSFAHLILPAALRSTVKRCPETCPSGEWEAGAVCVPKGMEGLKIKDLGQSMQCPECVPPCLTREMKKNIRYDGSIVNIPDCGRSSCSQPSLRFCMPPELRLIQKLQPLVDMVPLCGECETTCVPSEINQAKLNLPFGLKFPSCPPTKNNAVCAKKQPSQAMCLPSSLKEVKLGPLQSLPKCGGCVKPCLPKSVKKAFGLPDFVRIDTCKSPRCAKGKPKPMLCVPKEMRFLPSLEKLARDRTLPECSSCHKMCHADYIEIPDVPQVFRQNLVHCDAPCNGKVKPPALCVPPALRGLQQINGLYTVPTCKKCQPACIPPEVEKVLRARFPDFIKLPTCVQPRGEDAKLEPCIPSYLRLLNIPSLKDLGLPACKVRSRMCFPHFIKLKGLPLGLRDSVEKCGRCEGKSRKQEAICLPKQLRQLGIVKRMRSLTKGMPHCPPCVEPCMPTKLKNTIRRLAPQVVFPRCMRCRKVKREFCLPSYLRFVKDKRVRALQKTFNLKPCGVCTDMCKPDFVGKLHLPFGVTVPRCKNTCRKKKKRALCLPAGLTKLRLPHSSKVQVCPAGTRACLPLNLQRTLKLPKLVKIPECNKHKCNKPKKEHKQRLCIPRSMAKERAELPKDVDDKLIVCPVCTRSCVPKHLKPILAGKFKPPFCPVDATCSEFKLALCFPDELTLVKDSGLHGMNLAPCAKCERACVPTGMRVDLPFGMSLPACPSNTIVQITEDKPLKKPKTLSAADAAALKVKESAVSQSMRMSREEAAAGSRKGDYIALKK